MRLTLRTGLFMVHCGDGVVCDSLWGQGCMRFILGAGFFMVQFGDETVYG